MSNWRRGGIAGSKRKNKISEQFVYYTRGMIDSPAYRALSLQARKVLRRLELEHMAHGGQDNGKLPCRYHDFINYGCRKNGLSAALIEVEALGFAKTVTLGTRAFGNIPGQGINVPVDLSADSGRTTNERLEKDFISRGSKGGGGGSATNAQRLA